MTFTLPIAKYCEIVSAAEANLDEIEENNDTAIGDKAKFEEAIEKYKSEIFINSGKNHKYERGWDAAEQYGCKERIDINGKLFPHFRCQKGDCNKCNGIGYAAPDFEMNHCDDDDVITYTKFTPHTRCNLHGGHFIHEYDEKPKFRCTVCMELSEEVRKKKKAKESRKKFRTKHTEKLKDFVGMNGTYACHLCKMFSHKYCVILLGKDHKIKHRYEHARRRDLIVKLERDFAERFSASPDKEQQFQYFSKDTSLGMEGMTVYFKPKGNREYESNTTQSC